VLIIGGSPRMLGAVALSSLAALRSGCGLVTAAVPRPLNATVQKKISNEIMTLPLPQTKEGTISLTAYKALQKSWDKYTVIAIGPGLTLNASTQKLVLKIIRNAPCPLVIDADALNALGPKPEFLKQCPEPKVLTPHPGEMARLTGFTTAYITKNRKKVTMDFAKKYRCALLLKGHRTFIADHRGNTYLNKTGNNGMATAGCGDVLTGIIAALFAQKLSAFQAAKYGAFIHGKAADLASKKTGKLCLIASDIITHIPKAFKTLKR
jgi:NAD(P)H-hydrate epimerase